MEEAMSTLMQSLSRRRFDMEKKDRIRTPGGDEDRGLNDGNGKCTHQQVRAPGAKGGRPLDYPPPNPHKAPSPLAGRGFCPAVKVVL